MHLSPPTTAAFCGCVFFWRASWGELLRRHSKAQRGRRRGNSAERSLFPVTSRRLSRPGTSIDSARAHARRGVGVGGGRWATSSISYYSTPYGNHCEREDRKRRATKRVPAEERRGEGRAATASRSGRKEAGG